MDFGLSEDQELLVETVRNFLAEKVPITRVRELRDAANTGDRAIWQALGELGVSGILIPEQDGGSGLNLLDAALVSQAIGHAATPTPFLTSSIMVPIAFRPLATSQTDTWLRRIASGEICFGLAITEIFSVREEAGITFDGSTLSGKAMMAIDASQADFILLAIGQDRLAVIRRDVSGLEVNRLVTIDATRDTSELLLENVEPEAIFENAGEAISALLDAGRIGLAADTLGACEAMIEQSVAYAGERKQFDRVIGSFQAVKHMCAELVAELEPARSLLWYAAHCFDTVPKESPLMACHTLAHISEIAREIASVSTQVHGGIGWTDEQNLHFWFKRIGNARHLLGGPESLRNRAAEIQGLAIAS